MSSGTLFTVECIVHRNVDLVPFERNLLQVVKEPKHLFLGIAHGLEQDGDRHLPSAIDANIDKILGIELQIQP